MEEKLEKLIKEWEVKAKENWKYNGDSDEENAYAQGIAQGYEYCIEDLMNLMEGVDYEHEKIQ